MTVTILVIVAVSLRIISNPLGNVFQKQLTAKGDHPLIVNFITYLLLSLICFFWAVSMEWPVLNRTFWFYSVIAGIAGALGNGFLVKALHRGALSVLGPINSYKSIVGIIFGIFLLSEIPNFWGVLGVTLVILGSYFVLDTTEERFSWALLKNREIQFRIMAMILTAIEAVFIKKIILASSTTIAFMSWCFFGAFFSFILLLIYRLNVRKGFQEAFRMNHLSRYLLLILCIGTMQFTTNYSFAHIPVGYALSLFQLSIILSILFGYRFFEEKDIGKKILGSLIMIGGSLLIILLKN
jgi:drug/metabolite transporter (DMT)-like permease